MSRRPLAQRPVAPRCRGGASSLLRLSSAAAPRWPSATELSDWARLSQHGEPDLEPMLAPAPEAHSAWFTRLTPTRT